MSIANHTWFKFVLRSHSMLLEKASLTFRVPDLVW